jgi:hypothetical protein
MLVGYKRFRRTYVVHPTLKMFPILSSETFVTTYKTTWRHNTEVYNPQVPSVAVISVTGVRSYPKHYRSRSDTVRKVGTDFSIQRETTKWPLCVRCKHCTRIGVVRVKLHTFLTAKQDGSQRAVPSQSNTSLELRTLVSLMKGCGGERDNPCPCPPPPPMPSLFRQLFCGFIFFSVQNISVLNKVVTTVWRSWYLALNSHCSFSLSRPRNILSECLILMFVDATTKSRSWHAEPALSITAFCYGSKTHYIASRLPPPPSDLCPWGLLTKICYAFFVLCVTVRFVLFHRCNSAI